MTKNYFGDATEEKKSGAAYKRLATQFRKILASRLKKRLRARCKETDRVT